MNRNLNATSREVFSEAMVELRDLSENMYRHIQSVKKLSYPNYDCFGGKLYQDNKPHGETEAKKPYLYQCYVTVDLVYCQNYDSDDN